MNLAMVLLATVMSISTLDWNGSTAIQIPKKPTYDEFAKLPSSQRDALYASLSPEDKAELLRASFQRWLDEHRATLSNRQVAAVREAVEFVTPELFRTPQDPKVIDKQLAVSEKLSCSLGPELAYSLAKGQAPSQRVERTWTQVVETWIDWVVECVVK
jgi:hypothetical protein